MSELVRCPGCWRERGLIPREEFGTRRDSDKPRTYCKACDRKKAREYKAKLLADPVRAAEYHKKQVLYKQRWLERPGNRKKQAEYQKTYERSTNGKARVARYEANKRWQNRNPGAAREASKRWYAKVMADPERHQAFLEGRRIAYRLRKEREGRLVTRRVKVELDKDPQHRVPYEPFAKWLKTQHDTMTYRDMAKVTHVNESKLQQIVAGKYPHVALKTVDTCLTILGGPPHQSLYPDV